MSTTLGGLTMPRPIPVPVRQAMFRLWQQGHATHQIATSLDLPASTVRRFLQRFRLRGIDGIPADYHHRAASEAVPSEMMQTAVRLRQEHPTWGAGLIRVQLLQEAPEQPVPSERTLQRWFERAGLSPAPAGRPPRVALARATEPHATWQMDAKEHIRIYNSEEVSWLRMIDECSGAALWTAVFPPRQLDARLRRVGEGPDPPGLRSLGHAGPLPGRQRLPLGVARRLLDRAVAVADRPGCRHALEQRGEPPRERRRRAIPRDSQSMVRALDVSDAARNCRTAWCGWTACTARSIPTGIVAVAWRPSRAWRIPVGTTIEQSEPTLWDWSRVTEHLAGIVPLRRVDQSGRVSVYNHNHYVGRIHHRKDVYVMYDPDSNEWVFADRDGRQLNRRPAVQLSPERVMSLNVSQR